MIGVGLPSIGANVWLLVGAAAIVGMVALGRLMSWLRGDGQYGYIEAFTGRIGQGKTTTAVLAAVAEARALKALLLSNIPLAVAEVEVELIPMGLDGPDLEWLMLRLAQAYRDGRNVVLLMDEAGLIVNSRQWQSFGAPLLFLVQQARHVRLRLFYTTQSLSFVDVTLRKCTSVVHRMSAVPVSTLRRRLAGKRPIWLREELFEPGDEELKRNDRRLGRRTFRYPRQAESMFSTDAIVLPPSKQRGADVVHAAFGELVAGSSVVGPSVEGEGGDAAA